MSRVGIKPVDIADGVTVNVDGQNISVKGSKGELSIVASSLVSAKVEDGKVTFTPANDSQEASAQWGLCRSLVNNMIVGVTEGFKKELELIGVGYRAQVQGKTLKLNLGFSHDVEYNIPEGIEIKTPKPTQIEITGISNQKVGQVAAEIRKYRKPEPYKGKGVRYVDEYVRRKEGKKK